MDKLKNFLKSLNRVQITLYIILAITDVYFLGITDFIEHKLYGILFVVINACLIWLIKHKISNKQ